MDSGRYFSKHFNSPVALKVTKYTHPYSLCEECGKRVKVVYSVTPESYGLEYIYGGECVKHLGLKKMKTPEGWVI